MNTKKIFCALVLISTVATATEPTWEEGEPILPEGRSNPYLLDNTAFQAFNRQGRIHVLNYPVTATGLLLPYQPLKNVVENNDVNIMKWLFKFGLKALMQVKTLNDVFYWVGLSPYPQFEGEGIFNVPFKDGYRPQTPMGLTFMERNQARGLTIGCAECHSSQLFGKTVLGMSNRFPRANRAFVYAKLAGQHYAETYFQRLSHATAAETAMMTDTMDRLRAITAKKPVVLGLDTSLAQVALSLNRREPDEWATRSKEYETHPRADRLDREPADSKPAVWWNLKYKNRWLSDGSVVSGNPILTNILWNEVGRGADLKVLQNWIDDNPQIIAELTTAVFASEAPRWTDFFPPESIDIPKAKHGEQIFKTTCARCHGMYEKGWSDPNILDLTQQLKTTSVRYHQRTPVVDVGTDPLRWMGMTSLEKLNSLATAKQNHVLIKPQKGYVPPPLVGIWARWPYFHNNSAPSLCAVLTASNHRPKSYYSGPALDPQTDFDQSCVGYPQEAPRGWFTSDYYYNTKKKGLSNSGHDEGIFLKDGVEVLTPSDKSDIIEYLKTL